MYYVYILISERFKKTYTGITDNPYRRLRQHNLGDSTFTKKYCPWKLVFLENFKTRTEARKREKYLKSAAGRRWMRKEVFREEN